MNIFDTAKLEIKKILELAKYVEQFDHEVMFVNGVKPTKTAMNKRNRAERRYVHLLKKYT